MEEFGLFIVGLLLTLIFAGLTAKFWWKSRHLEDLRTLKLGRLTVVVIIGLWITLNGVIGTALTFSTDTFRVVVPVLLFEVFVIIALPLLLGIIVPISIVVLTIKMWRRESKNFANLLLPIIVFAALIVNLLYLRAGDLPDRLIGIKVLAYLYPLLSIYLGWQFFVFFLSAWVYGRRMKRFSAKYSVVLGAGLIDGEKVGKLLGNRILAAVKASKEDTILIFSGGKGPDEKISEALAMQKYAVEELKFPIERTLLEDQSRTTYENLVFSSKLISLRENKEEKQSFMFFSSDYHVFRAALFAASLNLKAQGGRGGKTAMYYRVPAFIREFIAVLNMQRRKHIFIVGGIVVIFVCFALLQQLIYFINH